MTISRVQKSFVCYRHLGIAVDPIHVGTGGTRLGRVDNTIVRDPATKIPKIPGSSLAGALRAYVAMAQENTRDPSQREKPYYPDCAGQGQPRSGGSDGHCGQRNCPVCTVFGFARSSGGSSGFAGLAAFSDMHLLLFPVPTREGPMWITSPSALQLAGADERIEEVIKDEHRVYRPKGGAGCVNLGWLMLEVEALEVELDGALDGVPENIRKRVALVSDKLFSHIVNSNLETRTSVAIDASTGAAQDGALFTYEALPRGSVLQWEVTCRFPGHFSIDNQPLQAVQTPDDVHNVVKKGYPYLEALGIGGMTTRGMGRLRVLGNSGSDAYADGAQGGEA
ncbi:MAG: type III-B CRISPR module RAMP protein Cmr4 [Firmicutes bacterium]|nr:type III-B CRISPR module RAMP protein Cmr4 [Bacillota bacterium]